MILYEDSLSNVHINKLISSYRNKEVRIEDIVSIIYTYHKEGIHNTMKTCLLDFFKHRSKVRYALSLGAHMDETRIVSKNEYLHLVNKIKSIYSPDELVSELYLILYGIIIKYFRKLKPQSNLSRYIDKYLYIEIVRWIRKHYDKFKHNIEFIYCDTADYSASESQILNSYAVLYSDEYRELSSKVIQEKLLQNRKLTFKKINIHNKRVRNELRKIKEL